MASDAAPGRNMTDGHQQVDGEHAKDGPGGIPPQHLLLATVSQVPNPEFMKLVNRGPLGLIGFALTTFVLGLYQCGAGLPDSNPISSVGPFQAVFSLAIFFGGFAQFVAGVMEFRVGNTFGTTRAYTFALGIYLILWCFLTVLLLVAALRTNCPSFSSYSSCIRVNRAGGAFAVICATFAFYASGSGLMVEETTFVRFPLGAIPRPARTTV
ncbi:hypothetical protein K469DRAFT_723390 [Zopfia rhizophila CBS 207.26]|uniref:Gpr1 family protein n=1 Tax=Zopfia rhizophila CBS 207.26 TaxID=1314779 RepID=A0A6A6DC43_9PEZI|nr:hypothetical protein K469DRAFT_723390 [Zopfia rhizophila CBS 207.26]